MVDGFIWLEGVNFVASQDDTNDLSTIRGGSLALIQVADQACAWVTGALKGAGVIEIKPVLQGASIAAIQLSAPADAIAGHLETAQTALRQHLSGLPKGEGLSGVVGHLCFTIGTAHSGEAGAEQTDAALEIARARARRAQLNHTTFQSEPIGSREHGPCALDRIRPGTARDEGPDGNRRLSAPVKARRDFGRQQRQAFYSAELKGQDKTDERGIWSLADIKSVAPAGGRVSAPAFVDDLHQMVAQPAGRADGSPLALSLRNKVAVFYADGNKFTWIRDQLAKADDSGAVEAQRQFSAALRSLQGQHLLPALLRPLVQARDDEAGHASNAVSVKDEHDPHRRLRYETLMWGGDEILLVVPAWLGFALAQNFFREVQGGHWTVGDHRLTFSAGLVFASYKTPITRLKAAAKGLVDELVKPTGERLSNKLSVEVFESLEPPLEGIAAMRRRLLAGGGAPVDADWASLDTSFVFGGDAIGATLDRIAMLKQTLPRSQLFDWLSRGLPLDPAQLAGTGTGGATADLTARWIAHAGRESGMTADSFVLEPAPPGGVRPQILDLYLLAQLWDFVAPLAAATAPSKEVAA